MLRLTLLLVMVTMLAAGTARGYPAKQSAWLGHIHKAKNFLLGNKGMPANIAKTLLGITAAGVIWGQALAPACALDCPHASPTPEQGSDTALEQVVTPEKGSDTALQQVVTQEKGSDTALQQQERGQ